MEIFWVDKYRPKKLDDLEYGQDMGNILKLLAKKSDLPHIIFHGPNSSGKSTRIYAFLNEIFSKESINFTLETFKIEKETSFIEVNAIRSLYHVELSPSEYKNDDLLIVRELIKQISQNQNATNISKILIINDAEELSSKAQDALKRTMENSIKNIRIFFKTRNIDRIIEAIRSRCICIRVGCPTPIEVEKILKNIVKKENINEKQGDIICKKGVEAFISNNNNLRWAILYSENFFHYGEESNLYPDWIIKIKEICKEIGNIKSLEDLKALRVGFKELLTRLIDKKVIFTNLLQELLKNTSEIYHANICESAAEFDARIIKNSDPLIHFEGFVINYLRIINSKN